MEIHDINENYRDIIDNYSGNNPYIFYLKGVSKKKTLSATQIDYIIKANKFTQFKINKFVEINKYYAESLKNTYFLENLPKKIYIFDILLENEKSFHILAQIQKDTKPDFMWIPKSQIVDDLKFQPLTFNFRLDEINKINRISRELRPHQVDGINFLLSRERAILADEMGSGKTMQVCAALKNMELEGEKLKVLIICPATLKLNWRRELMQYFNDDDISICSGSTWVSKKITIINYDILDNFYTIKRDRGDLADFMIKNHLIDADFNVMVCDEAHTLSNNKSIRSKVIIEVTNLSKLKHTWLITGTPITNKPINFYNILKVLKHEITNNWEFFVKRYCDAKKFKKGNKTIWITTGASNLEELFYKTKNIILRRKKDILNLPDKILNPYFIELNEKEKYNYDNLWNNYIQSLEEVGGTASDIVKSIMLRQYLAKIKIKYSIELAEKCIENGEKVIIFTNFKDELQEFVEYFKSKCVYIDGSVSMNKRQDAVDNFENNDKIMVFVGQVKAAGVGITLLKGVNVIMNSLDWVPGNTYQSVDRSHRMGQENIVNIFFPLFKDSVDEYIWDTLFEKAKNINIILNENDNIFNDKILKKL